MYAWQSTRLSIWPEIIRKYDYFIGAFISVNTFLQKVLQKYPWLMIKRKFSQFINFMNIVEKVRRTHQSNCLISYLESGCIVLLYSTSNEYSRDCKSKVSLQRPKMSVGLSLVLSSGPLIHHITSKAAVSSGVNNLDNVLQMLLPPVSKASWGY